MKLKHYHFILELLNGNCYAMMEKSGTEIQRKMLDSNG